MSKLGIIIKDVYKKNVKSAAFVIMILAPFLVMGIFYLAQYFFGDMSDISKIGVVANQPTVSQQFEQVETDDYTFTPITSEKEAQKQMEDETIDAYLELEADEGNVVGKLYSTSSLGTSTELEIQQNLNQMQSGVRAASLSLTTEQVQEVMEPAAFESIKVNFENGEMESDQGDASVQMILSFLTTIIMFVFIMTYSSIISQEIASEKGTRIMEVLLSSMKAKTHYYGKLFGILLVAFTQLAIYGVALLIAYQQFKDMPIVKSFLNNVSIKSLLGKNILVIVGFMLIGIFIYAVLSALCGSLVNKAEDTAKAIQPVMYLSMIGYMLGLLLGAADPTNVIIKVASYIPFISSYCMPLRLASNTVHFSGALVSLAVLLVTTIVLTLFSAQLYKSNVLVYSEGGTFSALKQSLSIMRNEKRKK